jgi:hypothetical protein
MKKTDRMLMVPEKVINFLYGSAPLDGVWYGEKHPLGRPPYWWRRYLDDAVTRAASRQKKAKR